ncbi:hypothetical protein B9Z55_007998 [Caenorhabditis nigoni]|uniref:Uncharacterized protein n=1 Tax=Caenorhabditis nigoni TaxID=1611254 RepID=A0A2G5VC59_9PELO|nr:hypothetical protein B9Z55_007998 [Caenorhabditis nigoni]
MLTNLSSFCVLEYLSFERRLYIVSQIPGFRKVEKSIPLHLDYITIWDNRIRIDENDYYLKRLRNHQNENSPASWRIELRKRTTQYIVNTSTVCGLLSPIHDNLQNVFKKLLFVLIENRTMIYTKKLEFSDYIWDYPLPVDLKIQAQIIDARVGLNNADLDRISNFLGPNPLKEFSIHLNNFEIFTHPIVRNSRKLVLWRGLVNFDHQRINHRNIHLKDYDRQILMDHMDEWIENGPEVGMEFSGHIRRNMHFWELIGQEIFEKERMYLKKYQRNGKRVKPDARFPNTLYSISMPQTNNPNTEIQYSLIKNESINPPFHIHLKIQPSGTATPEQSDSMYWELKLLEIRRICETGQCRWVFVVIFIFCMIYVHSLLHEFCPFLFSSPYP